MEPKRNFESESFSFESFDPTESFISVDISEIAPTETLAVAPTSGIIVCLFEGIALEHILSIIPLEQDESARKLFDLPKDHYIKESEFESEEQNTILYEENILQNSFLIDCLNEERAERLLQYFQGHKGVRFVQFNQLNVLHDISSDDLEIQKRVKNMNLDLTPNDPKYPSQWGLQKINAEKAWDVTLGDGIKIAVIDTGVDYNHTDIELNMWKNTAGKFGYDFSDSDDNPKDYQGHGTHVAGTVAALVNNNKEVAGVAPKAKVMAIKVFPNALDSNCAMAIKYAVDSGAKVINCSWGSSQRRPSNPILEATIDYAFAKNVIVVFSAGNNNDDVAYYSPANYPKVISVAATNFNDERASFSNYGDLITIAAPGEDILSLRMNNNSSVKLSGTSMAAPHVAGCIAQMIRLNSTLSFEQIKKRLQDYSDIIVTDRIIGNRLNAYNILRNIPANIKRYQATLYGRYGGVTGCASSLKSEAKKTASAWIKTKRKAYPKLVVRSNGYKILSSDTNTGRTAWPDNERYCNTSYSLKCFIEFYVDKNKSKKQTPWADNTV